MSNSGVNKKRTVRKLRPRYSNKHVEKKERNDLLTLKSLVVNEYARWHATPKPLRADDLKTEEQFLQAFGYSKTSRFILSRIAQIAGFWTLRDKYAQEFKGYSVSIAIKGLHQRAEGMTRNIQRVTQDGDVVDLTEEIVPDPTACKTLLEAHGNLKSAEEKAADTLANAMTNAAKIVREK